MKIYHVTIFRQSRVLAGLFLFPVAFFASLFGTIKLSSLILTLPIIILYGALWYYFAIGKLDITLKENRISFEWQRKVLFNFKQIDCISINEIKSIIIEGPAPNSINKIYKLRKIKTNDRTIHIDTAQIKYGDASNLINELKDIASRNKIEIRKN